MFIRLLILVFLLQTIDSKKTGFQPKCSACRAAIYTGSTVLKVDYSEPVVVKLATLICKLFAKHSWTVCDGISTQFKEAIYYVFAQVGTKSPAQICGMLIPECEDSTDKDNAGWEVKLPPKRTVKRKKKNIRRSLVHHRPLRVLQLSDLHIDFDYAAGSEADCSDPVCCRESNKHKAPKHPAGYWGTIAKCDIPIRTLENMLKYIQENIEVDYIMMSGDYLHHVGWNYSKEEHIEVLRKVGIMLTEHFEGKPIYWALGNHEGVPVNSFATHNAPSKFWPTWLYAEMANLSQPWISSIANETMYYRGSYSVKVAPGLKLISLNSGYCLVTNFFLYLNQTDPDRTISWLVHELHKSELAGEKVHIMTHIPPGNHECLEGWARNYYRIIQRFSTTITGQMYGHDHRDYFVVFYEDMHDINSRPIGVGYATPSITTFSKLNPGFRVYEISTDGKYEVLEIENYSADLKEADEEHPPEWKLLYKAKRDLNLPDLSPASWESYIRRLEKNEVELNQFLGHALRTDVSSYNLSCRQSMLCSLRMGHHNSSLYCPYPAAKYCPDF